MVLRERTRDHERERYKTILFDVIVLALSEARHIMLIFPRSCHETDVISISEHFLIYVEALFVHLIQKQNYDTLKKPWCVTDATGTFYINVFWETFVACLLSPSSSCQEHTLRILWWFKRSCFFLFSSYFKSPVCQTGWNSLQFQAFSWSNLANAGYDTIFISQLEKRQKRSGPRAQGWNTRFLHNSTLIVPIYF